MLVDCTSLHLHSCPVGHECVPPRLEVVDLSAKDRLDPLSVIENERFVLARCDEERLLIRWIRNEPEPVPARNCLIEPRLVHGVPELVGNGFPVSRGISSFEQ